MKKFRNLIAFLFCMSLVVACKVGKDIRKRQDQKIIKEQIITKTIKKGDTVTFLVPRVKYKDTTITTINKVGTILRTKFDRSGNVSDIKCIEQSMNEFRIEFREAMQKTKEKDKKEEAKTSVTFELIAVLALALLFIVNTYGLRKSISTIQKTIQDQIS